MDDRRREAAGRGGGKLLLFLLVLGGTLLLRFGQSLPLVQARESIAQLTQQPWESGDYEAALETLGRGFVCMTEPEGALAQTGRQLLGLKSQTAH